MKKYIYLLVFAVMISFGMSYADTIDLEWDANTPVPDGYRIFQRINDGVYGIAIVPNGLSNSNIPATTTRITVGNLNGVAYQVTNFHFVARAFIGSNESGNSNEVVYTIDRTAPDTPSNFSGSFDKIASEINLLFDQSNQAEVLFWKIFYSEISSGSYIELIQVENSGLSTVTIAQPFTYVSVNEIKTIYFVIRAYRDIEVYSSSQEIPIVIDRRTLVEPVNLRIIIPVQ